MQQPAACYMTNVNIERKTSVIKATKLCEKPGDVCIYITIEVQKCNRIFNN